MEASSGLLRETPRSEIDRIFILQKLNEKQLACESAKERKSKLKSLLNTVLSYREEIHEAIYKDCRRHPCEVDMTEIYPVVSEIKHACRDVHRWMSTKRCKTPLALLGSSSMTRVEPKGKVLIISPWNFPINLTLGPLALAVAAGNAVILKPSEFAPHANKIIKKIVTEVFTEDEVFLVEGAVDVTQYILDKPFDHIFFTGSPAIGKVIMKAASAHLASVTLELGGKSPTIVHDSADVDMAAKRIAWGKFVNNGQICIAPDYILVHNSVKSEFIEKLSSHLDAFYPDPQNDDSYSRIINDRHFNRINSYLEDARDKGATISYGGHVNREDCFISPTVLSDIPVGCKLMKEEIFGPLLPVVDFDSTPEVLEIINSKEKPLALYVYGKDKKFVHAVHTGTSAGATCINHNAVHFYNTNLPFGGVNNSGIGKSHGEAGFMEFSNNRAIFRQNIPNALELLVPPYNDFKQKLIDLTLKYF